jgi:phosphoribosylformylglycinamidine synthase
VALAESAFSAYHKRAIGFEVDLEESGLDPATLLFAESPSRMILSTTEANHGQILEIAGRYSVAARRIGRTGGDRLIFNVKGRTVIDRPLREVEGAWRRTFDCIMDISSIVTAEET